MTSYNREKYIAEAIESVLSSTFKDFELIVVDDCSKDQTIEIARRYQTDPRVRVHINEKNLGDYPNRNRAAELARGKYLKYIDADDLIYPHGLDVMVEAMERFPDAALGLAMPQDMKRPYPFRLSPQEAYQRHFFDEHVFMKAPLSAIIRTQPFRDVGGFSPSEGPRGDFEMWLRISATYPVVLMPNGLVWWRAHEEQETRYRLQKVGEDVSRNFLLTDAALAHASCPLNSVEREQAMRLIRRGHARRILQMAAKMRLGLAREVYRKSEMSLIDMYRAFTKK
jgi:glycosyltransferase involved in cell wall biosynthesis